MTRGGENSVTLDSPDKILHWLKRQYPAMTLPAAPGSTTDTLARLVADQLAQKWGKPTIVENIPGGAMNIGASNVARAAPDGYTMMVAPPAPLSFSHLLYKDLGFDSFMVKLATLVPSVPYGSIVSAGTAPPPTLSNSTSSSPSPAAAALASKPNVSFCGGEL